MASGTGAGRCETGSLDAGSRGRSVSGGKILALHSSFLPERILCCSQIQGEERAENAQGNSRQREPGGRQREGKGNGSRSAGHEAFESGKEGRKRD